jgi:biopolymer transport protein ExbD
MRLHKHKRAHGVVMDMTPMIDVTFQLIIFFMTVSQASIVENELLDLPQMTGALDQTESTITINVTRDQRLVVIGETLTLPELEQRVAQVIADKGGRAELVTVVLRVDRENNSALVNKVMTALKQLNVQRIRIAVEVPDGS